MHRYRLLPPLFDPPPKRPIPLRQQVGYIVFRCVVGLGFFVAGFLSAFGGAGLKDYATNFQTTFGVLPFHWMYAAVLGLGYLFPFLEMLTGVVLIAGFVTKEALMLGYCLLMVVLTEALVLRSWTVAEPLPVCFAAVTLLLLGRHRFDGSWMELLRKRE